jgi:alpha-L-fucosidase
VLYAIEMDWPKDGTVVIRSIKPSDHVRAVDLVANDRPVTWQQRPDGLHLALPKQPIGENAFVYRIELSAAAP